MKCFHPYSEPNTAPERHSSPPADALSHPAVSPRVILLALATLALAACSGAANQASTPPSTAPELNMDYVPAKALRFTWSTVSGATEYRLQEDPDGASSFATVTTLPSDATSLERQIFLPARINARYRLQACNSAGCTTSAEIPVDAPGLAQAVGYIKAANTGDSDQFGTAVALSGDGQTLAVGAPMEDSSASGVTTADHADDGTADNSGAVYIFTRNGRQWTQQAYIKASNAGAGYEFGKSVSLSDDGGTLAVGAWLEGSSSVGINTPPLDDGTADRSGAVYVFVRNDAGDWTQQAYIKASNTGADDIFGISIALSGDGDTLAVGAFGEDSSTTGVNSVPNDDGSADDSGASYVFVRDDAGDWSQQAYLKARNTGALDGFGTAVSLSGDGNMLAVGAFGESNSFSGVWMGSDMPGTDNDNDNLSGSGAAYVFVRNGQGDWTQQAYIKASNPDAFDRFGWALDFSDDGDTLAVGAWGESSNTEGIDTIPVDDGTANLSGAVYVFTRNGIGNWLQQAYIKPGNTSAYDRFGISLDLSSDGNRLAVGAFNEDGDAIGVNPASNDNSDNAGAVYLFSRDGAGDWSPHSYLKASNTGAYDSFGGALSISSDGDTLAVSAPAEDSGATGVGSEQNDDTVNESGAVYLY